MRNLQVFREERVKLKLDSEGEGEVIVAGTYDSDHGRLFLASSSCNVYSLSLDGQVCLAMFSLADCSLPNLSNCDFCQRLLLFFLWSRNVVQIEVGFLGF